MKFRFAFIVPVILAIVAGSYTATAQSSVDDLKSYMEKIKVSTSEKLPESVLKDEQAEQAIIDVLRPYLSDTLHIVRQKAYYITKRVAQKSKSDRVQESAINNIVTGINDKDSGIAGNAIEYLTGFNKKNFLAAAKDAVRAGIDPKTAHLQELLKLAGYLELTDQMTKIEQIVNTGKTPAVKWAGRVALARLNNEAAINWILSKLSTATINDDFVYEIVPDLVYTRQPVIFEFLEQIINSNQESCESPNPDSSKKILCGYRVMESVAMCIRDFPVKTDDSGDLMVSDYKQALDDVRNWFAAHPSYTIATDTF